MREEKGNFHINKWRNKQTQHLLQYQPTFIRHSGLLMSFESLFAPKTPPTRTLYMMNNVFCFFLQKDITGALFFKKEWKWDLGVTFMDPQLM